MTGQKLKMLSKLQLNLNLALLVQIFHLKEGELTRQPWCPLKEL